MSDILQAMASALEESRRQGVRQGFAAAEQALTWLECYQPRTPQLDDVTKWFKSRVEAKRKELANA